MSQENIPTSADFTFDNPNIKNAIRKEKQSPGFLEDLDKNAGQDIANQIQGIHEKHKNAVHALREKIENASGVSLKITTICAIAIMGINNVLPNMSFGAELSTADYIRMIPEDLPQEQQDAIKKLFVISFDEITGGDDFIDRKEWYKYTDLVGDAFRNNRIMRKDLPGYDELIGDVNENQARKFYSMLKPKLKELVTKLAKDAEAINEAKLPYIPQGFFPTTEEELAPIREVYGEDVDLANPMLMYKAIPLILQAMQFKNKAFRVEFENKSGRKAFIEGDGKGYMTFNLGDGLRDSTKKIYLQRMPVYEKKLNSMCSRGFQVTYTTLGSLNKAKPVKELAEK